MPENELMQNNKVNIYGEIISDLSYSHEVFGEAFYNFSIKVKRLSESVDILPATISERLIGSNIDLNGKWANIRGQLRSYNNFQDKKNRLILTVFVREIDLLEKDDTLSTNDIFLNGYVCKKPLYRTTPFGREIVDLLIAVNRTYNKSDYIPAIAWGRNAKFGASLDTGDELRMWGRIQSREYQKKMEDGEIINRTAFEVSISKIESQMEYNVK